MAHRSLIFFDAVVEFVFNRLNFFIGVRAEIASFWQVPLVISLVPRCQKVYGSAKYLFVARAISIKAWRSANSPPLSHVNVCT